MACLRSPHGRPAILLISVGIGLAVSTSALAEEDTTLDLTIASGVDYSPDYEGSDDYEFSPLVGAELTLFDGLATVSLGGVEAAIPIGDRFFAGVGIGYDGGRDEDDSDDLRGLGDVDGAFVGSLFGGVDLGDAELGLGLSHALGSHKGYVIDLSAEYEVELIEDTAEITFSAGTTWASQDYTQAFFGIDQTQAAASGLDRHEVDAGFKNAGVGIGANHALTDWLFLGVDLEYQRLLGDAADSPIVDDRGSANQFSAVVFLATSFGVF